MEEAICETVAHKAGFAFSVGNWISPDGMLITGEHDYTHHFETLINYLDKIENTDNDLKLMNEYVEKGYIRIVFRNDAMFHINAVDMEEIWGDSPNYKRLILILNRLNNIEIHIFSKMFYIIGFAQYIVAHDLDSLEIRKKKSDNEQTG